MRVSSRAASSAAAEEKLFLNITQRSSVKRESSSAQQLILVSARLIRAWLVCCGRPPPSFPHRRGSVTTYHKTRQRWLKLINRKRRGRLRLDLALSQSSVSAAGLHHAAEPVVPVFSPSPSVLVLTGVLGSEGVLHDTRKQNQDCFSLNWRRNEGR